MDSLPAGALAFAAVALGGSVAARRREAHRCGRDLQRRIAERSRAALRLLNQYLVPTPLENARKLAKLAGCAEVWLKREDMQRTGSFKLRGALVKFHALAGAGAAKLPRVTASTGNHALAVLEAARVLHVEGGVEILVPETLDGVKGRKLAAAAEQNGATVVRAGRDVVESEQRGRDMARQGVATYISPYNDEDIIVGQSTVALELLDELAGKELDAVLVPVGGGGLVSGIAAALRHASPSTAVTGCQPANNACMAHICRTGRMPAASEFDKGPTLADGTAGSVEEGALTISLCRCLVDRWVLVPEARIAEGMRLAESLYGARVEGAAGCAIGALLEDSEWLAGKRVAVIVCGGNVSDAARASAGMSQ